MRSLAAAVSLIAVVAITALATGEWEQDDNSTSTDDGNVHADVGGVKGWVGGLEAFHTTHDGNGFTTTGKVGTVWDGEQGARKDEPSPVEKTNKVTHAYTRDQEGAASTSSVGVTITSAVTVSGSAHQRDPNDPQWWWDTNSTIDFLGVSCRAFDAATNQWSDLVCSIYPNPNWPSGGVNDGGAGAACDANNNNSQNNTSLMTYVNPPPSGTTDDNGWAFNMTAAMTKIEVTAKWKSIGRPASVDNAVVTNERHQLAFTFTSCTSD